MRRLLTLIAFVAATASAQQPFTLQQVLSAPYALSLTASPTDARFAWVENDEGVRNIWIGGPKEPARQLTQYEDDDGQDITALTWSPDGDYLAYVYGAESGASGKPANPAHLQRPTTPEIWLIEPASDVGPVRLGEGHSPLFSRDSLGIYFVRSGQIWRSPISARMACPEGCPHSKPPTLLSDMKGSPLVYDRGTPSGLTLSPDGKILAYISHRRTHSFLALFNVTTQELTFPAPSTGDDSAPAFSRDGKQLAWLRFPFTDAPEFAGNRTSPNPWSIQILNVATNETRTLFQPEANKPGSAEPRMSTGEPHLYWTAPRTPSQTLSSRPNPERAKSIEGELERPAVSSGNVLFFSETDGWVHLYSIATDGNGGAKLLTPGAYEVEDASLSANGKDLTFSSNDPTSADGTDVDRRHVFVMRVDGLGLPRQLVLGNGIQVHPLLSTDGEWIAMLASTPFAPMHVVFRNRPKTDWSQPGNDPEPRFIDAHSSSADYEKGHSVGGMVEPQLVLFPSSDKLFQIHGQLFLPKSSAPANAKRPAILFFHGGPKRQMLLGYPAMDYYSNAYAMNQYLASRGYIVLSVNYRGGIGYGLDFRQCQHCGADGAAEYNDALGAVAYLRSRPDVDIAHIGIWGGSYGGYFTALALARNSDLFAAGVDFHGVHEWAREDNAAADWLRGPLAEQEKIAALAHASSPMADIAKWKSPVLLIHGDDDPEVAYTQTPMLADALRARGVHVEELIFPDELHGFLLHKDWLAAYEAAANFFDRTLKPAPTPSK